MVRKEALDNSLLSPAIEGKRASEKQYIIYLLKMCILMTEQCSGGISKFIDSNKIEEIVERNNRQCPECTRQS